MTKVAVVVQPEAELFGIGVFTELWAERYHPEDDNPVLDFVLCAADPGEVTGSAGFSMTISHGLSALDDADIIGVSASTNHTRHDPRLSEALRRAHGRGAVIVASCGAVFALGYAGLLDGRRCATHWRYAIELQEAFPLSRVDVDVLYVDEGGVVTGAGSAAGIDANLHLFRRMHGARQANNAARRIVVPPHRDGGQAQYVTAPMPEVKADSLAPVLDWAQSRLDQSLSVADLAARAMMSERTFARRFRAETGTTPWQWLLGRRVALAEELLETTDLPIEQVAVRAGFGNAATLRQHFGQIRGTSPAAYRRTFGCASVASA